MSLKGRIKKAEEVGGSQKTACFFVKDGKASGSAWWAENIRWKNLSREEFEEEKAELDSRGVKVIVITIPRLQMDGSKVDAWDDVKTKQGGPGVKKGN